MADKQSKTVDLVTIDAFKHGGRHYARGDVLLGVEPDLALELTGAGRTKLSTQEDLAASAKATKAAKTDKDAAA